MNKNKIMKTTILVLISVLGTANLFGQNIEERIKEIRRLYEERVKNEKHYTQVQKDVTANIFPYFVGNENRNPEAILTSYSDTNGIKIIDIGTLKIPLKSYIC